LKQKHRSILEKLGEQKVLKDEIKKPMIEALEEFSATFQSSKAQ